MEQNHGTQSQTQPVSGGESPAPGTNNQGGQAGTGSLGGQLSPEPERVSGEAGPGAFRYKGVEIIGGILAQLQLEASERLREAEECIEWYQREKAKVELRLSELERLRQQIEE